MAKCGRIGGPLWVPITSNITKNICDLFGQGEGEVYIDNELITDAGVECNTLYAGDESGFVKLSGTGY